MVYHPNDPLPCGARLWIETESNVDIIDEMSYLNISKLMKKDREEYND